MARLADAGLRTGFLQTIGYASNCMLFDSSIEPYLLPRNIASLAPSVNIFLGR